MANQGDDPVGDAGEGLRGALPRINRLDMEQVRARTERSLFGSATPAKLGRYVLLEQRGDGGMGVVHAAYDPELHRKVALKILHPGQHHDRAHERLIAEARALAKLDHPNVVKVHDVLTHGDQVVLVMEWVEGETLASWERMGGRAWRDVLPVYLQAAQGLAAAHRLGIIHRDFKPANAILGADGRVRVLDFGLARSAGPAPGTAVPPASALAGGSVDETWPADLTATGAMVGTFAYASPEQLEGTAATFASDQFSFAVSLHRAIEGIPPFSGGDLPSRRAAIRAREIARAADGRAVPAWLRAAITRALAVSPGARFASMQELLAVLARPRGWRRWRVPAALGALAAVASGALLLRPSAGDPRAACDGGAAEIEPVWHADTRTRLAAAFERITTPGAGESRDRVLRGLDGYRARWTGLHRDACMAHRRGVQSAALLDHRMRCMHRRLVDLQSAVAVLQQVDAASEVRAVDVVARLPAIEECADLERLQAPRAPPPGTESDVIRVQARLSEAAALDRIGRHVDARALAASAVAEAERTGHAPLIAEAALLHGRILLAAWDMKLATAVLARALELALQHGELAIAVEAGARKLFTEGAQDPDLVVLERDAAFLLPLSLGLQDDHFARPLLLNNVGSVYLTAGDRARALPYFRAAHDALAGVREIDPELTCIDRNLARITEDPAAREALARTTWLRLQATFGAANLATLDGLSVYARLTADPARALPLIAQACDAYAMFHPGLIEQRTHCESYRAFLAEQLGDREGALRIHGDIIAAGEGATDAGVRARVALATGSAALLRGNLQGAVLAWGPLAEADARSPHWWVRLRAAHAELGLGTVARLQHRHAEAAAHFERAVPPYREVARLYEETEYRLRLDLAQAGLDLVRRGKPGRARDEP